MATLKGETDEEGELTVDASKATPTVNFGDHWRDAFNFMKREVGEEAAKQTRDVAVEVYQTLVDPTREEQDVTLLFGMIQSGKTHTMSQSLGLAADNGFRLFIVLTSDNNTLYTQTSGRLRNAFQGMTFLEKEELKAPNLETTLKKVRAGIADDGPGVVIFCSKNTTVLADCLDVLRKAGTAKTPSVVFDDEADQASLNANAFKGLRPGDPGAVDPSPIHDAVTKIRTFLKTNSYVAVTATPQALFLQETGSLHKPNHHVLMKEGKGYQGGEHFLMSHPQRYYREVAADEIANYTGVSSPIPSALQPGMKKAVATFLVAASMCMLDDDRKDHRKPYSMLMHISMSQALHTRLVDNVTDYLLQIREKLPASPPKEIKEAYDDLTVTVKPEGISVPKIEEVCDRIKRYGTHARVQEVNYKTTGNIDFTDDTKYGLFNVFIGGNVLGRGMTIKNLITTYYGRDANAPQIDTVMQHARWYGYRMGLAPFQRLFMPKTVWDRFRHLHHHDQELRAAVQSYLKEGEGIIPLLVQDNLRPTRRNVLEPGSLGVYAGGQDVHPHFPNAPAAAANTKAIEDLLKKHLPKLSTGETRKERVEGFVTLKDALWILDQLPANPARTGVWETDAVKEALKTVNDLATDKRIRVVHGVDLTRNRTGKARPVYAGEIPRFLESFDKPEFHNDKTPPIPTLFLLRVRGDTFAADGPGWNDGPWDGEGTPPQHKLKAQFYVPSVAFPRTVNGTGYGVVFRLD